MFSLLDSEVSKYKQIQEHKESLQNNISLLHQLVQWNSSLSSLESFFTDINSNITQASLSLKEVCDKIEETERISSNNSQILHVFENSKIFKSIKVFLYYT